ncbi:exodeoxyribonuclease VII large subunit [bacterium]|nr:exodeoxyribonuclease VII large subunit [bacterium]
MMQEVVVPVSAFVRDLKNAVEGAFGWVALSGEITNISKSFAGHTYFTLKDESAQIRCAVFKNQQKMIRCELKNDMSYIVYGKISVYEAKAEITLVVSLVIPYGDGMAALRLKALKEKLKNEGLFDLERKKKLPRFPLVVGVVTAENGAAIHDIIKVSRGRFPAAGIILSPALVQGAGAAQSIIDALKKLEFIEEIDAIIIGRGGGAKEDLEPFNSEDLARAVAACQKPVVSAVGHETDSTVLDLVADYSVPTPSAAAELVFPDAREILSNIDSKKETISNYVNSLLNSKMLHLDNLVLSLKSPSELIKTAEHRTERLLFEASNSIRDIFQKNLQHYLLLEKDLEKLSPLSPLERGFAIVTQGRKTVKKSVELDTDLDFDIRFGDGTAHINNKG